MTASPAERERRPVWTIVVAGGSGERFGGEVPKQFLDLGGRRVVDWSLAAARAASDGVVLVVPEGSSPNDVDADEVVTGGATRAESVRAGLACVPDEATIIVVHDAARPLASPELFRQVIEALDGGCDAVVPGVPVTDTIKIVDDGQVVETLERARLVAVQTPQAFRAGALRRAHAGGAEATDDAALIELAGGTVHVIPGEPSNLKITLPADIEHLGRVVTEGHG